MEGWTADLADGALGPEDALDRLRDARTELTELLNRHAETVIEGFARTEREARLMRREMEQARSGTGGRKRPGYEPSILGTVYPSAYFFAAPAFSSELHHRGDKTRIRPGAGPRDTESAGAAFPVPSCRPASR